jgi:hypothetical protein
MKSLDKSITANPNLQKPFLFFRRIKPYIPTLQFRLSDNFKPESAEIRPPLIFQLCYISTCFIFFTQAHFFLVEQAHLLLKVTLLLLIYFCLLKENL